MKNIHQLIIDNKTDSVGVLSHGDDLTVRISNVDLVEVDEITAKEAREAIRDPKVEVKFNHRTKKLIKELKSKDIVETENTPYNQDKPKQKKI